MPSFLLEVGTEELPAHAVAPAVAQLKSALVARLESERLAVEASAVRTFATPRRLTLLGDLPARQPDAAIEVRGPSAKAAFGADGAPTKAAQGFAAKQNVPVESLVVEGEYVVARRTEAGKSAGDVLAALVPELLKTITFPKFMRWGAGNYRFGRPLRRFVALLDEQVVSFVVDGVASGNVTVGHRDLAGPAPIVIARPALYEDALRAAFVEPDPARRRARIVEQAETLAQSIDGRAVLPAELVDENVFLTEWVTCVLGAFDPAYLALPRPILETAMQKHQRFFPVASPGGGLLPHFIAVRNGDDAHLNTVRAGYEKVLASRFSDAKFFFDHDRQSSLHDKVVKTERIVFQEKLGTLADKTKRLEAILEGAHLLAWTHDAENARRAVHLAKADLASEIVAELPALQGVMGREFALLDGESNAVADALREQYLPRTAGDALPQTRVGSALALADRADTLVGYVSFVGAEPKGSSDPFGLKRAAGTLVDLLARDAALPGLDVLVNAATRAYQAQNLVPAATPGDLWALLETRVRGLLEERGLRYDLIDAVLGGASWSRVARVVARADALSALLFTRAEADVAQAATRVRNILRGTATRLKAVSFADASPTRRASGGGSLKLGEEEWWPFDVTQGGTFSVGLPGGSSYTLASVKLFLIDANGSVVAQGETGARQVTTEVKPGLHFVRVVGSGFENKTGSYNLEMGGGAIRDALSGSSSTEPSSDALLSQAPADTALPLLKLDPKQLTTPDERTLFAFLGTVAPQVEKDLQRGEYTDALDTLAALSEPINRFFDHVLVMAEDPAVRAARLALLARIDRLYLQLADFSKLILE